VLLVNDEQLRKTVEYVLRDQDVTGRAIVSLAIVDDETIKRLKEEYFQISQVSDVISFDLRDDEAISNLAEDEPAELDCEVVVNAQRALAVARQYGTSPEGELNLYVVHGLLHQLGFDDKEPQQGRTMHEKENQLLEGLGFGSVFGSVR
jgi:probable rRNA maturation factor